MTSGMKKIVFGVKVAILHNMMHHSRIVCGQWVVCVFEHKSRYY